jgi:PIN domain nuclease of toxin-antitoxin system
VHLDTHAVVWLASGELERFPVMATQRLEDQPLRVSPMVRLELGYLYEIHRIADTGEAILEEMRLRLGLEIAGEPFDLVALRATSLSWTRDPFDRLIAAQALVAGESLLTVDRTIRAHLDVAV